MKKRFFSLLLALTLVASAFCFAVSAAGSYDATVTSAKAVYDPDAQKISYSFAYTGGALMEAVMNLDKANNGNNVLLKITVVGVKTGAELADGVQVAFHTFPAYTLKGDGKSFAGELTLAKNKFNLYETVYVCVATNAITGSTTYPFEDMALKVVLKGEDVEPPAPVDGVPCEITLTPSASSVKVGETVSLKVSVKNVDTAVVNGGLLAITAPIKWDSKILKFKSCANTVIPEGWDTLHDETAVSNGSFELNLCDDTGLGAVCSKDGFFEVTLNFVAIGTGLCNVSSEGITVADSKFTEFVFDASLASVAVLPSATGFEIGDVNGDGGVDALDAAKVLQHDAGLITLTANALARADVNGDGLVDAIDASKILQYDAGIIGGF